MSKASRKSYGSKSKRVKVAPRAINGHKEKNVSRKRHQDGCLVETQHGWSMRYYVQESEGQRKRTQKFLGTFAQLTKPQAKTEMDKVLATINNNPIIQPQTTLTFEHFADKWIAKCESRKKEPIKASVIHGWRSILKNHLVPFMGTVPLAQVDSRKLRDLVNILCKKGLSPATIQNVILLPKLIKKSARDADDNRLFEEVSWDGELIDAPEVKPKKQRKPTFKAEEISKLVSIASGRMQMLIILLASSGLRIGEALGLEVKHFTGTSVEVKQAVWRYQVCDPKTENAERVVDLAPNVCNLLREYINGRKEGFIFRASNKRSLLQSNIMRQEFHPLLDQLGISHRGFHCFRRFRITYLRNNVACPDGLLKVWAGHAPTDETDNYDQIKENAPFRQQEADRCGVGFDVPKTLTAKKSNGEKSSQLGVNAQSEGVETPVNVG
jgi:integrase